jgi:hypothetical protein
MSTDISKITTVEVADHVFKETEEAIARGRGSRDRGFSDRRRDARNAPDRPASPQEPQGGTSRLLSPAEPAAIEHG